MSLDARVYSSSNASSRRPPNPLPGGLHKDVHTALHKCLLVTSQPDTSRRSNSRVFQDSATAPILLSNASTCIEKELASSTLLGPPFLPLSQEASMKKKFSFKVAQPQLRCAFLVCGSPSHPIQSQSLRPLKEKRNTSSCVSTWKSRPSTSMLAL